MNVLPYHPFLIKPNNHELGEIFGVTLETTEDILRYARKLQEMGAGNVLVSRAKDGALLLTENGDYFESLPPQGDVVNSVGAGDSMVAGFVAGYRETGDYEKAFYMGLCCGSASAFSEGMATRDKVVDLLKQMNKEFNA